MDAKHIHLTMDEAERAVRYEAETIVCELTKEQDKARTKALKAEPEAVRIDFLWGIVLAYADEPMAAAA